MSGKVMCVFLALAAIAAGVVIKREPFVRFIPADRLRGTSTRLNQFRHATGLQIYI